MNNLRQNLSQKRALIAKDAGTQLRLQKNLQAWLARQNYNTIAIYWPIRDEFNLLETMKVWANNQADRHLLLPHTQNNQALMFQHWNHHENPQHLGLYQIPEVGPEHGFETPQAVLVPTLGWLKRAGKTYRLGYGGGFYDRTMASYRSNPELMAIPFIGISYQALEIHETWQPAGHDEALDELLTD